MKFTSQQKQAAIKRQRLEAMATTARIPPAGAGHLVENVLQYGKDCTLKSYTAPDLDLERRQLQADSFFYNLFWIG